MNWHYEENKLKLHILHSLARSQRALARIIESMADVSEIPAASAERVAEQIDAISRYQKQLAVKLTGIRIRKFRRGHPGALWLNRTLLSAEKRSGKRESGK
ncbi:hypothetical protein N0M98_01580 [Paenibacillus doosanensis]|uniref:Uncharacterized protein n=1 Tax=Paenibacillus konkukensis TaxID=2020716 RepID=A0ABY4RW96_9BACL|nr:MULTISPECIES: hypothetical protein [Paenibacillus]MCS7458817.1 hypothetical protein [Paenibacillus doosanensis]UQZ86655.1 hypothetical protein SK3146_05948 [Paenibacillus konkukensis]